MAKAGEEIVKIDRDDFFKRYRFALSKLEKHCNIFVDRIYSSYDYYSTLNESEQKLLLDEFTYGVKNTAHDICNLYCEFGIRNGFALAMDLEVGSDNDKYTYKRKDTQKAGKSWTEFSALKLNDVICSLISNGMMDSSVFKIDETKSFNQRYKEKEKELREDMLKFLKASDTFECRLSIEERFQMYFTIAGFTFEDMFNLYFEAGLHCGILMTMDLGFAGEVKITPEMEEAISKNQSIVRQIFSNQEQ